MGSYFGYAVAATDINSDGWVNGVMVTQMMVKKKGKGWQSGWKGDKYQLKQEAKNNGWGQQTEVNSVNYLEVSHALCLYVS